MKSICKERSVEEGVAALFAYEAMLPQVSKSKIEGLKKHYNISDADSLSFFTTHIGADAKHSDIWLKLLEKSNGLSKERLEAAVNDTCDALNLFLDGVLKHSVEVSC